MWNPPVSRGYTYNFSLDFLLASFIRFSPACHYERSARSQGLATLGQCAKTAYGASRLGALGHFHTLDFGTRGPVQASPCGEKLSQQAGQTKREKIAKNISSHPNDIIPQKYYY